MKLDSEGRRALAVVVAFVIGFLVRFLAYQPLDQIADVVADLEPVPRVNSIGDLSVGPYACEDDCSGHLAGWRAAAKRKVREENDCYGSVSDSFSEGCLYFLQATGRMDPVS